MSRMAYLLEIRVPCWDFQIQLSTFVSRECFFSFLVFCFFSRECFKAFFCSITGAEKEPLEAAIQNFSFLRIQETVYCIFEDDSSILIKLPRFT